MGSSPSGTFGYGLILPELSEWKPVDTEWLAKYTVIDDEEYPEDVRFNDDEWDMLEDLVKRYPVLAYDIQYCEGWSEGAGTVFFAKSTEQNIWDISRLEIRQPKIDEILALGALAEFLGIPPDIGWTGVVSYG